MHPPSRLVLQSQPIRPIHPKPTPSKPLLVYRTSRHHISSAATTSTVTNETYPLETADPTSGIDHQWKSHQKINPTIRRAFQESLQYLKRDAERIKSQIDLIASTRAATGEEPQAVERLEILSQINDFQIRNNHHLGHQVDMTKPIYRFLERQRWRKEGRLGRLMETVHRLRIFPDLFPSFDPQLDLKLTFQPNPLDQHSDLQHGRFINIGNFIPSSRTTAPPTLRVQVFHEEPRLYTIMMVDPDVPDPENHTFTSFLHWLVPNVPISATTNGDLALSSGVEGEAKVDYIGPHPAEGSQQHRYTILVFEQANNASINITDYPESLTTRSGFSARRMAERCGLTPVGVLAWVSQWDPRDASSISSIYTDQLKISEPRYGREPKPFDPRVKLPPHSHLPLTHRHPPVIPWRQHSSATATATATTALKT